jgi:hypothetical protein
MFELECGAAASKTDSAGLFIGSVGTDAAIQSADTDVDASDKLGSDDEVRSGMDTRGMSERD